MEENVAYPSRDTSWKSHWTLLISYWPTTQPHLIIGDWERSFLLWAAICPAKTEILLPKQRGGMDIG